MTRRPGYREAVEWLSLNEDPEWITSDWLTVTGAMVRDLWGKTDEQLRADCQTFRKRNEKEIQTLLHHKNADHVDGYDRDDLGESPDY